MCSYGRDGGPAPTPLPQRREPDVTETSCETEYPRPPGGLDNVNRGLGAAEGTSSQTQSGSAGSRAVHVKQEEDHDDELQHITREEWERSVSRDPPAPQYMLRPQRPPPPLPQEPLPALDYLGYRGPPDTLENFNAGPRAEAWAVTVAAAYRPWEPLQSAAIPDYHGPPDPPEYLEPAVWTTPQQRPEPGPPAGYDAPNGLAAAVDPYYREYDGLPAVGYDVGPEPPGNHPAVNDYLEHNGPPPPVTYPKLDYTPDGLPNIALPRAVDHYHREHDGLPAVSYDDRSETPDGLPAVNDYLEQNGPPPPVTYPQLDYTADGLPNMDCIPHISLFNPGLFTQIPGLVRSEAERAEWERGFIRGADDAAAADPGPEEDEVGYERYHTKEEEGYHIKEEEGCHIKEEEGYHIKEEEGYHIKEEEGYHIKEEELGNPPIRAPMFRPDKEYA